ncbi:hypothetical protein [Buttiauxella sp.]|uniref:hypothetical protein n=1 Tax=Buttiauxella sp. TaxID=1972222 RepID=UPI003C7480F5
MFNIFKGHRRIAELELALKKEASAQRINRDQIAALNAEVIGLATQRDSLRKIADTLRSRIQSHGMTGTERDFLIHCQAAHRGEFDMSPQVIDEYMTAIRKERETITAAPAPAPAPAAEVSKCAAACAGAVVCKPECPEPEYYKGDLEEVAHAVLTRVTDAMHEYQRVTGHKMIVATHLMDGIRSELKTPGYVEALLQR